MLPFQYVNLRMNTSIHFFKKNCNNTTLIWKRIRQLLTPKSKSKIHPNTVKVKDRDIVNTVDIAIANVFKIFFIDFGPNLSKTIYGSSKPFKNFLNNSSLNFPVQKKYINLYHNYINEKL